MIKENQQNKSEMELFQSSKAIYEKLTAISIRNGENLKAFPLRSETRQGCLLFLFNSVLAFLVRTMKQREK